MAQNSKAGGMGTPTQGSGGNRINVLNNKKYPMTAGAMQTENQRGPMFKQIKTGLDTVRGK